MADFIDSEQFVRLFNLYFEMLARFVYGYVKDETVAKDIVHDTFCTLWERRFEIKDSQYNDSEPLVRGRFHLKQLGPQSTQDSETQSKSQLRLKIAECCGTEAHICPKMFANKEERSHFQGESTSRYIGNFDTIAAYISDEILGTSIPKAQIASTIPTRTHKHTGCCQKAPAGSLSIGPNLFSVGQYTIGITKI